MFPRKGKAADIAGSVQRFADIRRDPASRVKHLKSALESLGDPADKRQLLEDFSFEAFHLVHELLCLVDIGVVATANRSAIEVEFALWTLEQILCLLPDLVCQRWQYRAIEAALKKCLYPQNVTALRKIALRLFLLWYQTLGANGQADAELDAVFVVLLPHFPLPNGADAEALLQKYCESIGPNTPGSATQAMLASQSPPTPVRNAPLVVAASLGQQQQQGPTAAKQRAQTLQSYLEKFFEYICRETSKLEWRSLKTEHHRRCLRFLIDRLKVLYIPSCFADLAVDNVDLYEQSTDGIVRPPPARPLLESSDPLIICRYWLIRWVAQYAYSHKALGDSLGPAERGISQFAQFATPDKTAGDGGRLPASYDLVREVLFGSKENVNLVLSLLREGLLLPFQCSSVMTKVFRIVREWIFQEDPAPFMQQPSGVNAQAVGVPAATETLLYVLTSYFGNPYLATEQDRVQVSFQVSQRILGLLKDLANPQRTPLLILPSDTWSAYLRCLLRVVDRAVPPSPTETQSPFTLGVATSLFQAVLGAWVFVTAVRAVRVSDALWNDLLDAFTMRTAWCELIDEWGKVLDSVTRALALYFYGIDLLDPPLERSSEQTVKKMVGIAKRRLGDSPTVASPTEKADQYNFCQQKNSPLPPGGVTTPVDERRSIANAISGGKSHAKLTATSETTNRMLGARDMSSNNNSIATAGGRSGLARYAANGSGLSSDMEHGTGDSGRGSGPASYHATEMDDNGSVDSATFAGGGLMSGSDHSVSGAISDVIVGGTSPIFGSDRDSLTPSPRPSASIDDELDNEFDLEQDKTDDSSIDLTPRDVAGQGAVDTWMLVWRRVLCILGDINSITDPMNHLKAVHAVTRTVDSLIKVRANQGVSVDAQVPVEPVQFVPPLLWVAPWLLSTAELPQTYAASKREAVAALCRIFLHHQLDVEPSRDLVCQYLVSVRRCLTDSDPLLVNTVLAAVCPHLFFERVTGADALFPSALIACRTVIDSHNDAVNKLHAIQFAAILANTRIDSPLAKDAQTVLLSALSARNVSTNGVHLCINGLCLRVLTEGQRTSREKGDDALDALFDLLATSTDDRVAMMICENLCALFDNFTSLPGADRGKITAKLLSVYELILNRIETIDYNLVGQLLTDLVELGLRQTGDAAGSGSVLPLLLKTVDRCSGRAVDERKSHLIAIVRSVFAHLVQFYAQFPLPQFNVAQLNCVEWAEDTKRRASTQSTADIVDGRVLVGLNREGMLWSVGVAGGEFSLTTRSIAGKHCWSVGEVATAKPKSEAEKNGLNEWLVRVSGKLHSRRVERERSQSGIFGAIAEPLTELCEHIAQSSPECLPHAQFPDPRAEPFLPCEADVKAAVHQSAAKSLTYEPASTSAIPNSPINSWHQWRSLLADLDVPQWSKRNSIDRVAADKTHMLRSLRHLDQLVVRDVHKFAVIYVADGQEEKTAILANKIGSIQFEDFVARLGWTVDMKEHAGYSGGLPADCQTPYYATLRTEAIFHVSTRLPDDATKKLRHIGNDEVHIVWSEHWRDYRRNTIATKFCDVLIVVYPLPSRLFRVSIETTKPLVFGPLFDGALVDWVSLPALIRVTAINASRAYRRLQPQWTAPSQHRAEVVNQTLGELRKPSLYSGLVSHLYSPDNSLLHDIIPTSA